MTQLLSLSRYLRTRRNSDIETRPTRGSSEGPAIVFFAMVIGATFLF